MPQSSARLLLSAAAFAGAVGCSNGGSEYCSGQWSVASKYGNCDTTQLNQSLEIIYAQPNPQACETALKASCSAAEASTLNARFTCQQAAASVQPTCVDGGETAWSDSLLQAQTSCLDAGVSDVCLSALEQSQQPDGGSGNDGGPLTFCNRSIGAGYNIGTCDFGDAGLILPFVGDISSTETLPACQAAVANCTMSDLVTLNAQVDCADQIPYAVGTCAAGGEAAFIADAEAKYRACQATSSNMTQRCVDALTTFGFYSPDGG
jgi:hypothetical protein